MQRRTQELIWKELVDNSHKLFCNCMDPQNHYRLICQNLNREPGEPWRTAGGIGEGGAGGDGAAAGGEGDVHGRPAGAEDGEDGADAAMAAALAAFEDATG
ncbi:unnamed protein product [Torque teno tamarin virus]|uniref:Uncharacterized ORF2 protein n=1 Tax=Torque teno tamarin virus (isolate So-TTV2) TaxID=766186 RepID=ORF2_TTVE1|nr:hypothetical protein TTtaV_gp1 [Torque teno tamarin virus]Q9DUC2.1 RecName: Full=Uncharacterized ORF2 protein [Torque teno tamarin virus (isolate So-TTV2)]BAB19315.1 unnamed protein product [Torque teno tamarin virus]